MKKNIFIPKLVVTDLDGTFVKYNTRYQESSIVAADLLRKKGIILVLATGRGLTSMGYIKKLDKFDYLIGGNGAFLYDIKLRKYIFEKFIERIEARKIIDILNSLHLPWATESKDSMVFSSLSSKNHAFLKKIIALNYKYTFAENVDFEIAKLLIFPKQGQSLDFTYLQLQNNCDFRKYSIYKSFETCEIVQREVTKWKGVEWIMRKYNLSSDDIMAIGDSDNDYEMLINAGFSIAMGNSLPKIKDIANFVTRDVSNDGWAWAFRELGVI